MMDYFIRRPIESDIPEFRRIAETYTNNPLVDRFQTCAVVEGGKDIKGFGVTRNILEAVLYCEGTKRDRAAALELLLGQAISDGKRLNANQLYVFVVDSKAFEEVLCSHYGFKVAKGTCLILEI